MSFRLPVGLFNSQMRGQRRWQSLFQVQQVIVIWGSFAFNQNNIAIYTQTARTGNAACDIMYIRNAGETTETTRNLNVFSDRHSKYFNLRHPALGADIGKRIGDAHILVIGGI